MSLWETFWSADANKLAPFNTLFAGINLLTLFFLFLQIRSKRRQDVKDDIISAGRHADEIYGSLFGIGITDFESVVEHVYRDEIIKIKAYLADHTSNPEVEFQIHEFWYVRRIFAHVARMANLAESKGVRDYYHRWIVELEMRMRNSIILRALAFQSLYSESWNLKFRDRLWVSLNDSNLDDFRISPENKGKPSAQRVTWPC